MDSIDMNFSPYDTFWSHFQCINSIKMKNLSSNMHKSHSGMTKRHLEEHQGSKWCKEFIEVTFYQLIENISFPMHIYKDTED